MPYPDLEERMDRLETVLTTFIQHTDRDIAEMRQWRIQSQKQWGEIAQKMGSFVEDIVAPNIARLAEEHFSLGNKEDEVFSARRLHIQHPGDASRMREFDCVYVTKSGWIIV